MELTKELLDKEGDQVAISVKNAPWVPSSLTIRVPGTERTDEVTGKVLQGTGDTLVFRRGETKVRSKALAEYLLQSNIGVVQSGVSQYGEVYYSNMFELGSGVKKQTTSLASHDAQIKNLEALVANLVKQLASEGKDVGELASMLPEEALEGEQAALDGFDLKEPFDAEKAGYTVDGEYYVTEHGTYICPECRQFESAGALTPERAKRSVDQHRRMKHGPVAASDNA